MEHIDEALALLEKERRALLEAVAKVPEAERTRRPAEGMWSVVEVLEHLARVEKGVARLLVVRGTPEAVAEGNTAAAGAVLTPEAVRKLRSREYRLVAPERVQPAGTSTPAEALRVLEERRVELLSAIANVHPPALDAVAHDHVALGPLNLRGWIEFLPHHEARHAEQVLEIASMLAGGAA